MMTLFIFSYRVTVYILGESYMITVRHVLNIYSWVCKICVNLIFIVFGIYIIFFFRLKPFNLHAHLISPFGLACSPRRITVLK